MLECCVGSTENLFTACGYVTMSLHRPVGLAVLNMIVEGLVVYVCSVLMARCDVNRVVLYLSMNTLCTNVLRLLTCSSIGHRFENLLLRCLPLTTGGVTMLQWLSNVLTCVTVICLVDVLRTLVRGMVDYSFATPVGISISICISCCDVWVGVPIVRDDVLRDSSGLNESPAIPFR